MKKLLFSLILAVLVGFGIYSLSSASQVGNELSPLRTIPLKSGSAVHVATVVVAHGGVLRYISGTATSANATWIIYDSATLQNTTSTNGLVEGGQATQYGVIGPIDLGDVGINFVNGIMIQTTTADITVLYY